MKISDRVWVWSNRKPPRLAEGYLQIVFLWALYGGLVAVGILIAVLLPKSWYIGVAVVFFCLVMMGWFYWWDQGNGVVELLHQHRLQRYNERKERIEGEK